MTDIMNYKKIGEMAVDAKKAVLKYEELLEKTEINQENFKKIDILKHEKEQKILFLNGFMEVYKAKEKVDLKEYTQYEENGMKYVMILGQRLYFLDLETVVLNTRVVDMFPNWRSFMVDQKYTLGEHLDWVEAAVSFPTMESIKNGSIMFTPDRAGKPSAINLTMFGIITRLMPRDLFVHAEGNLPLVFKLNDKFFLVAEPKVLK